MRKLVLNMAQCSECEVVCISVHVHDFRTCLCGAISVDGGLEYIKRGGALENIKELSVYKEDDGYFRM